MAPETRRLVHLLALVALVAVACGGSAATTTTATPGTTTTVVMTDEEMTDGEMMGDVLEVAGAEGDLGVFLDALGAAGIMNDLHGEGPYTLFIPTDEAFDSYLDESGMSQEEVFAGAEMLQAILNFHIVNMIEDADMVMGMSGASFTTASGEALEVTVDGDVVMVGGATIERYDIEASNGIIHVIDTVLIPPGA